MTIPGTGPRRPKRYKAAGAVSLAVLTGVMALLYYQYEGDFAATTQLTMITARAGLTVDVGSKVSYNGVQIGRVTKVDEVNAGGAAKAKLGLRVDTKYVKLIPANVDADIKATTLFGNKYVVLSSPTDPVARRVSSADVIEVSSATTELNTVFETLVSL